MNRTDESDDTDRLFEVALAEELTGDRAQLAARVLAADLPRRAAALRSAEAAARTEAVSARWSRLRHSLLAAAVVLLGLGAVIGALWLRPERRDTAALLPPQDPAPDAEHVVPRDMAEFRALAEKAQALVVTRSEYTGATRMDGAGGLSDRLDSEDWPETLRVDGAELARWQQAIAGSTRQQKWSSFATPLRVELLLPDRRKLRCFVTLQPNRDLAYWVTGVPGDDPIVADERLLALLDAAETEIDRRHRFARGEVNNLDELLALPADCRRIRCPVPELGGLGDRLARFPALAALRLDIVGFGRRPDDAILADLRRCVGIEELDLRAELLTDASLAALAALPRLQRLTLRAGGPGLTGTGFLALQQSALREVSLRHCTGITPAGLQALAKVPGIATLRCFDLPLGDDCAALSALAGFPRLEVLELGTMGSEDRGDALLPPLLTTKLRRLVLADSAVTGAGLARLRNLPSLRELTLVSSSFADADLEGLAALRQLRRCALLAFQPPGAGAPARAITITGLGSLRAELPDCAIECRPGSRLFPAARSRLLDP